MAAVGLGLFIVIILLFLLIVLLASVKIVKEYERGVVFPAGPLDRVRADPASSC